MRRRRILALIGTVAAATAIAMGGQASGQTTVTSGAFCSPQGATGVTSTGIPMTCTTTATDSQARWRATSEVTTTTVAAAVTTTTAAAVTTTTLASSTAAQTGQTTTTVASTGTTTTTIRQAGTGSTAPIALTG